jgi:cyclic pyranopterin phosphate synthase
MHTLNSASSDHPSVEISMVDITSKSEVVREATSYGFIKLKRETVDRIKRGEVEKGNVFLTAKLAGIMAAKKTYELIPMCHQIPLTSVEVDVNVEEEGVSVKSRVKAKYGTGVEMEALTAVTVALLTVWDMVKKYEKDPNGQYPSTEIAGVRVVSKEKRLDQL